METADGVQHNIWAPHYTVMDTIGVKIFFLYMDPLTHGGVPGPSSRYPQSPPAPPIWPLATEDLAVVMLGGLLSGTYNFFQNSIFSETLSLPLGWVWVIIW